MPEGVVGLRRWTVLLPEAADVDELRSRVRAAALEHEDSSAGLLPCDPWGNRVLVTSG